VVLAAIAVAFVALDLTGSSLSTAHGGVRGLLGSLYRGTDAAVGPARRFVQGVPDAGSSRDKIAALQRENAKLRQEVDQNQANAAANTRLDKLQLIADSNDATVVPARVIAFGPGDGFEWTVTVDVGTSSGVGVGQTVTDGDGLVGRVLHSDSGTAVILLVADPGSGVGVRDVRTNQLAVLSGRGVNGFGLSPLLPSADLKVGDQVQTAPAGQSTYAPGLVVGVISAVRVSGDGTTTATVKPATSPTALDIVGVITSGGRTSGSRAALTPGGR